MILLLICTLFCARLFELLFPAFFGQFGDMFSMAKKESEKDYKPAVTELANVHLRSYIMDEAFLASFISLIPILIFSYKTGIIITSWFILFYLITLIIMTMIYSIVNLIKSEKIVHKSYHPNIYRSLTVIIVFLSFTKIYMAHI